MYGYALQEYAQLCLIQKYMYLIEHINMGTDISGGSGADLSDCSENLQETHCKQDLTPASKLFLVLRWRVPVSVASLCTIGSSGDSVCCCCKYIVNCTQVRRSQNFQSSRNI